MEKFKVIIAHGAYGHPEENWLGWMKRELEAIGIPCWVPAFPTPEGQKLKSWLKIFEQDCSPHLDSNTILIGHSLGAAFILRCLETYPVSVKATILAGAFIGPVGIDKFDLINKDFFSAEFNWPLIQSRGRQFTCYHGSNDPYVSRKGFEEIAEKLKAKKIVVSQAGHMNAAAGYTQFPQLLMHLKQIME